MEKTIDEHKLDTISLALGKVSRLRIIQSEILEINTIFKDRFKLTAEQIADATVPYLIEQQELITFLAIMSQEFLNTLNQGEN